VIPCQAT
jgi:hypothetical protein